MLRSVASFGPLGSNVIVARPCSEIGHNRRRLCDRPRIFRILLAHGSWRGVIRTAVTILMFGLEFVRLNETAILAPDPPSAKLPAPLSGTQSKLLRRSAANATFLRAYNLPQPLNRLSKSGRSLKRQALAASACPAGQRDRQFERRVEDERDASWRWSANPPICTHRHIV